MKQSPTNLRHRIVVVSIITALSFAAMLAPASYAVPTSQPSVQWNVTIKASLFDKLVIEAETNVVGYISNADPITHELEIIPPSQLDERSTTTIIANGLCKWGRTFAILILGLLLSTAFGWYQRNKGPTWLRRLRKSYPRGYWAVYIVPVVVLAGLSAMLSTGTSCGAVSNEDVLRTIQQYHATEEARNTVAATEAAIANQTDEAIRKTEAAEAAGTAVGNNRDETVKQTAEAAALARLQAMIPTATDVVEYEPLPKTISTPAIPGPLPPLPPGGTIPIQCNNVGVAVISCTTCQNSSTLVVVCRKRKPPKLTKTPTMTPSLTLTITPTPTLTPTSTPTPTDTPTNRSIATSAPTVPVATTATAPATSSYTPEPVGDKTPLKPTPKSNKGGGRG